MKIITIRIISKIFVDIYKYHIWYKYKNFININILKTNYLIYFYENL